MRALRASCYDRPNGAPTTAVVLESDIDGGLDVWFEGQYAFGREHSVLVIADSFEVPDGTELPEAVFRAEQRLGKSRESEQNMSIAYFYYAAMFESPLLKPGGSIVSTVPAPLSEDDIAYVLERLAEHQLYKGHSITVPSASSRIVVLRDGKVEIA